MNSQGLMIDGQPYPSKGALVDEIRKRIAGYACDVLMQEKDARFFASLLSRHPSAEQKIGCGVRAFYVTRTPDYPTTKTLMLVRTDGSRTDWSWRECVRPTSQAEKVQRALRALVAPQTMAVKRAFFATYGPAVSCPIIGDVMTFHTAHVDHIPPHTFAALVADFLAARQMRVSQIALMPGTDKSSQERLRDPWIAQQWLMYHKEHAQLRVISARANMILVPRSIQKRHEMP